MYPKISLHDNLLIASFQLLVWLLVHPSAWRYYVEQIDATLPADFALGNVPTQIRHHPTLRRLQLIAYFILPILVGLLIWMLLSMIHLVPWYFSQLMQMIGFDKFKPFFLGDFLPNLVLGTMYGMVLCLITSILSSFLISFSFALVVSVFSGISVGIFLGIGLPKELDIWTIVLGIFVLSMAGSVVTSWHQQSHQRTLSWQIGSFVIGTVLGIVSGIVVGIIMLGIVLIIGAGVGILLAYFLPNLANTPESKSYLQIIGMAVTIGLFLGAYFKSWRLALKLAFLFGLVVTVLMAFIFGVVGSMADNTVPKRFFSGLTGGSINGIAFVVLFAVPYLLARRFASVWASVIAGILGSGGLYLAVALMASETPIYFLFYGLLAFILGLSQKCWFPILFYPFESAWNLLIYRALKREPKRITDLLPQHSAFWNEHQYLPLRGLERLLVTAYEQEQCLAQKAITRLSEGSQKWAVKATQIEANTQRLEHCNNVHDIGKVHETLILEDSLNDTVGKWLRSFQKSSRDLSNILQQNDYQQPASIKAVINLLEGTLTFANDKQSVEVQRFQGIAARWLFLLKEYVKKLEEVQEIPNPYIFGPPLENGQDVFVPRPGVDSALERLLHDRACPPLLLYGQRRMGKTSLLKNLVSRLPKNFVLLFVDCQGVLSAAQNHLSFFYNLGREITKAAKRHYSDLHLPPLSEETVRSDPATRFNEWLDEVEEVTENKTLLLVLDEFVTLENAFYDGRLEQATILGLFRNIIQHRRRFRLLLSGTHTFEELQHWANYLVNVRTVHLSYLSDEEAEQLIERPVKDFPLRYTSEATQRVMSLTRNQPAFLQLLCGEIVQRKDGQSFEKRLYVQIEDVEAVIPIAFEIGGFVFADIEQNQIGGDNGKTVLQFMASKGEGVVVSQEELLTQLSAEDLKETLALLLRRELIEAVNEEGYRFQIELVRRWFVKGSQHPYS